MASWSDFLSGVLQYAPGCPGLVAEDQVRRAARKLCEEAAVWIGDLEPVNAQAGVAEYALVATEEGAWVVRPTSLHFLGGPLRLLTEAQLTREHPGWDSVSGPAAGFYLLPRPGVVRLYPAPSADVAGAVTGRAHLKPGANATTCPDAILEEWSEVICNGALANILKMPRREWTDVAMAMLFARDFKSGLGSAMVKALKGRGSGNTLYSAPAELGG